MDVKVDTKQKNDSVKLTLHKITQSQSDQGTRSVDYFSNCHQLDFVPDNNDQDECRQKLETFIDSLLPFVDFTNLCIDSIVEEIYRFPLSRVVIIQHEHTLECFLFE